MMRHFNKIIILLFLILGFCTSENYGQIRVPQLISNGMVLQRNAKLKIWGWASPNEKITIEFLTKTYSTKTTRLQVVQ